MTRQFSTLLAICIVFTLIVLLLINKGADCAEGLYASKPQARITSEELAARQQQYQALEQHYNQQRDQALQINKEKSQWYNYSKEYRRNPTPSNPYVPPPPSYSKPKPKYKRVRGVN